MSWWWWWWWKEQFIFLSAVKPSIFSYPQRMFHGLDALKTPEVIEPCHFSLNKSN
jgi:hypothetical protein